MDQGNHVAAHRRQHRPGRPRHAFSCSPAPSSATFSRNRTFRPMRRRSSMSKQASRPPTTPIRRARYWSSSASPATSIRRTSSGGEIRRAALAHVMAPNPDILLLDEPTNHLDLPAIEWLEAKLASTRSALVLISHDRRFLERLSRHHRLARPRPRAPRRAAVLPVRGMARSAARRRGNAAAQDRPEDRRREPTGCTAA